MEEYRFNELVNNLNNIINDMDKIDEIKKAAKKTPKKDTTKKPPKSKDEKLSNLISKSEISSISNSFISLLRMISFFILFSLKRFFCCACSKDYLSFFFDFDAQFFFEPFVSFFVNFFD